MFRITRRAVVHLRRNVVGYLALTIALGGTSYAAAQLPRNSVGPDQIRANAVGASELRAGSVRPGDLPTLPAVRVDDDTQVELATANFTLLDLDDEVFDTAAMHPGNGHDDRIRVPRTGTYVLNGEVEWEPNGTGYRKLELVQLNVPGPLPFEAVGSSLVQPRDSTVQPTIQQVTAIVRLSEGDTIGLLAGQASGDDLELVRGTLSAAFVSP
jgi:hypothetical protein